MAVYDVFTPECLNDLFPIQRTNDFFDALFGDAEEEPMISVSLSIPRKATMANCIFTSNSTSARAAASCAA